MHFTFAMATLLEFILLVFVEASLSIVFMWIAFEIVIFMRNSKLIANLKFNKELETSYASLHQKVVLNVYCLAATFFLTGLTHVSYLEIFSLQLLTRVYLTNILYM